jgi:hypothetical protein
MAMRDNVIGEVVDLMLLAGELAPPLPLIKQRRVLPLPIVDKWRGTGATAQMR